MVSDSKSDVRVMHAPRVQIPISPPIRKALTYLLEPFLFFKIDLGDLALQQNTSAIAIL